MLGMIGGAIRSRGAGRNILSVVSFSRIQLFHGYIAAERAPAQGADERF